MTLVEGALDGASIVELLASVVIVVHVLQAIWALVSRRGLDSARLLIAEGVLAALGFSLAATLLKVIALQQWPQIRTFATVFVLRTLLKQVFLREKTLVEHRSDVAAVPRLRASTQTS